MPSQTTHPRHLSDIHQRSCCTSWSRLERPWDQCNVCSRSSYHAIYICQCSHLILEGAVLQAVASMMPDDRIASGLIMLPASLTPPLLSQIVGKDSLSGLLLHVVNTCRCCQELESCVRKDRALSQCKSVGYSRQSCSKGQAWQGQACEGSCKRCASTILWAAGEH